MKPSNPLHPYYIADHELTADIKLKLREISSRKHSNYKVAIATILASLITGGIGFCIWYFDPNNVKNIKNYEHCNKNVSIETILNIQDLLHKLDSLYNYEKSNANSCKIAMEKINDIHRKYYPEKYYSQFGYYKGKQR